MERGVKRRHTSLLLIFMLLLGGMLALLSITRYRAYVTGMDDLGHMAQAIWNASHGRPLTYTYFCHQGSRLSYHVELIYFLIAPIYALFPSPITLLILQAALFVAGAWPLFHLARRRLQSETAALAIALIYLLYPLAENAVLFDFHADTLAMPLFFFALDALDQGHKRAYFLWIALILISKVYAAYAVVLLGALLFLQGKRRTGFLTVAAAFVWGALAFFLIRPYFAARYGLPVQNYDNYLAYYFGETLISLRETWAERLMMGLLILLPLLPALRIAPWEVLAVLASIAPVLLSSGPGPRYSYKYHHYALSVPFVIVAVMEAARRMRLQRQRIGHFRPWELFLSATLMLIAGLNSQLCSTPLSPAFWQEKRDLPEIWRYAHTERDALKDLFISQIPPRTELFATTFLASHLTQREKLCSMLPPEPPPPPDYYPRLLEVDYATIDALMDYNEPFLMEGLLKIPNAYLTYYLSDPSWSVVRMDDGLVLMQRNAPPQAQLPQTITHTLAAPPSDPMASFDDGISLLSAQITPLGGRRFAWQITWFSERDGSRLPRLLAVSRLTGPDETRVLHLPLTDLYPTTDWQAGEQITERFEVILPDRLPPGSYTVWLGLYRMDHPFAYATDARSRIGSEVLIANIEVP